MSTNAGDVGVWHPCVSLDEFVAQVENLLRIIKMTKTSKLMLFDHTTISRALGWASYIEEVIKSLSTMSQRNLLARQLEAHFSCPLERDKVTVTGLQEARRWVLSGMLSSTFLGDHPNPKMLLKWILSGYLEISAGDQETHEGEPLACFVEDASRAMRSFGNIAVLSHAQVLLKTCVAINHFATTESGGVRHRSCHNANKSRKPSSSDISHDRVSEKVEKGDVRPKLPTDYEMSIETAQKRAYASECVLLLLSKSAVDHEIRPRPCEQDDADMFVAKMVTLAEADALVLEVLCLMLLESYTGTMPGHLCGERSHYRVCGNSSNADVVGADRSALTRRLLKQVLIFRNDARLWQLDSWLLSEISHHHLSFADAYLAHLLKCLQDVSRKNLLLTSLRYSKETSLQLRDTCSQLEALRARSTRLDILCKTALEHSELAELLAIIGRDV